MSDSQFSIKDENGLGIFFDCFGSGDYLITVKDKEIRFEWSDRFGPLPITKSGAENTKIGPRHKFWRAASLWNLQGKRLDGKRAIWHEPRQPVYEKKHLGGGHYKLIKVIDPGEPGHDW